MLSPTCTSSYLRGIGLSELLPIPEHREESQCLRDGFDLCMPLWHLAQDTLLSASNNTCEVDAKIVSKVVLCSTSRFGGLGLSGRDNKIVVNLS